MKSGELWFAPIVGRYNPEGVDPNAFAGRAHVRSLFGFCADGWDHNAHRIERTQHDVEFCRAVFQVVGRSTVLENDQAVTLDVGDVELVDSTTFSTRAFAEPIHLTGWRRLSSQPYRTFSPHPGQWPRTISFIRTRGQCPTDFQQQLKYGIALQRIAAEVPDPSKIDKNASHALMLARLSSGTNGA
jgi:hypothetical protein